MKIEIENLGTPRQNFYLLRDDLIAHGKRFDETSLPSIPYQELVLCCVGEAGEAACSSRLIREEKERRRERFLSMEPEEIQGCLNFLRVEQMEADILVALAVRAAPKWDDLSTRQKLWFKLCCIYNHIDAPQQRLEDAILLLRKCGVEVYSGLPRDFCEHHIGRLQLYCANLSGMKDNQFRAKIWDIAENILEFLHDEELSICKKEALQRYSCTSDCFRAIL
jgi:hypothetical protein